MAISLFICGFLAYLLISYTVATVASHNDITLYNKDRYEWKRAQSNPIRNSPWGRFWAWFCLWPVAAATTVALGAAALPVLIVVGPFVGIGTVVGPSIKKGTERLAARL